MNSREVSDPRLTPIAMASAMAAAFTSEPKPSFSRFSAMSSSP